MNHWTISIKVISLLILVVLSSLITLSQKSLASNLPSDLLNAPIDLIDGTQVSLKDFQGKAPVYLKFWATWCQPCRKEMPHFEQVQQEMGDKLKIIAINLGVNDGIEAITKTQQEFKLTMPLAIDSSGDLAQKFRLLGTPYHLLFDRKMNLVHVGNVADDQLNNKIKLITNNNTIDLLKAATLNEDSKDIQIPFNKGKKHILYFTATWCDWYLKDSRPSVSRNCIESQNHLNEFHQAHPNIEVHGIASRLWTGEKDLQEYKKKFAVKHSFSVDHTNRLFHQYKVKNMATFVLVQNNQVLARADKLSAIEEITDRL